MCTVTFVKLKDKIIITNNRDEDVNRITARPDFHLHNDAEVLFSKDSVAGGSWLGVTHSIYGTLLNGSFKEHMHVPPYRMSRGLVLLDAVTTDFESFVSAKNYFKGIEPFTIFMIPLTIESYPKVILWDENKLEVHDDLTSDVKMLCSVPLYHKDVIKTRKKFFYEELKRKKASTNLEKSILELHHLLRYENKELNDSFLEDIPVKTRSISQVVIQKNSINFKHIDLFDQSNNRELSFDSMVQ